MGHKLTQVFLWVEGKTALANVALAFTIDTDDYREGTRQRSLMFCASEMKTRCEIVNGFSKFRPHLCFTKGVQ